MKRWEKWLKARRTRAFSLPLDGESGYSMVFRASSTHMQVAACLLCLAKGRLPLLLRPRRASCLPLRPSSSFLTSSKTIRYRHSDGTTVRDRVCKKYIYLVPTRSDPHSVPPFDHLHEPSVTIQSRRTRRLFHRPRHCKGISLSAGDG